LRQGKTNLNAPWLGLTAFMVLGVLLSLLIFIGEGVRDAFDPRKTVAGAPPPEPGARGPETTVQPAPAAARGSAAE
jgi:microcin C transport system permease protein